MKSANIIPIRAFNDNYIWAICDDASKQAWLVDPGDAIPALKFLNEHHYTLAGILLTHHHSDHCGGVRKILAQLGDVPVYASQHSKIEGVSDFLKEDDVITCANIPFTILEIPGHTLDHIAFYGKNILFCGDTLFSAGCGRVFEGTLPQMYESLQKIMKLNDKTQIYCGHEYTAANLAFAQVVEPENQDILAKIEEVTRLREAQKPTLPSTLLEEKTINPFLRCDQPEVIKSVEEHVDQTLKTPVDVFAQLREWKNTHR